VNQKVTGPVVQREPGIQPAGGGAEALSGARSSHRRQAELSSQRRRGSTSGNVVVVAQCLAEGGVLVVVFCRTNHLSPRLARRREGYRMRSRLGGGNPCSRWWCCRPLPGIPACQQCAGRRLRHWPSGRPPEKKPFECRRRLVWLLPVCPWVRTRRFVAVPAGTQSLKVCR